MTLGLSIQKNTLLLLAFALVTAGVVALTHQSTKSAIAAAERRAAQKALLAIIPSSRIDNDLLTDVQTIPQPAWQHLGLKNTEADNNNFHIARKDGQTIAVIIPATAPDGYSGDIDMLVGVNRDGTIAGVRIVQHTETPGLGDKVDERKSDWVLSFNGLSLQNPAIEDWKVEKDGGEFDQFTGATITPRAVVQQVKKVLNVVQQHEQFFATKPLSASPSETTQP